MPPRIDQSQAQQLFDAGGFLVLPLERQGQEFGIDGNVWAVKSFAGVKFIPPGLHLFLYSSPSSVTDSPFGDGITIRKGFFRITSAKEVLVRKYDEESEEILEAGKGSSRSRSSSSGRKRKRQQPDDGSGSKIEEVVQETIVSKEYLKTLDPKLAPYPLEGWETWKSLTCHIDQTTLEQVLGSDSNGDSRCDGLMASVHDLKEGKASSTPGTRAARTGDNASKKMYWGKARSEATSKSAEDADMDDATQTAGNEDPRDAVLGEGREGEEGVVEEEEDEERDRFLGFPVFDLKRSWKSGATGEEITRDSRDKSWLLSHIIHHDLQDEPKQLLAQMQLAFLLITQLHNFSALEAYKRYITVISHSNSILTGTSGMDEGSSLSSADGVDLYIEILNTVLIPHLQYLRVEFFDEDLPGLDTFMLEELSNLRMAVRAALRHWSDPSSAAATSGSSSTLSVQRVGAIASPGAVGPRLSQAWSELRRVVRDRFGWLLGGLEAEDPTMRKGGKQVYNLLAQPDEEDEYTEEGEDAPVVVEM